MTAMTDIAFTDADAMRTGTVALAATGLTKTYAGRWDLGQRRSATAAVAGVDLELRRGTISGLVGQSGSGKSTIAKLLTLLERRDSGTVLLDGEPVGASPTTSYRRAVQMVFQDPFASLNPAHTIGYHLSRPLRLHHYARSRAELRSQSIRLLEQVKLGPAEEFLPKFPHQLSGGERQRVAIALALAVRPQVLLADEPVSMLDVSIRAGLLNLLRELADQQRLAVLYITHDIASARYFADTIAVMYAGRIVERGPARDVVDRPGHPYTKLLLAAAPQGGRGRGQLRPLPERSPGTAVGTPAGGCVFAPRCPQVMDRCTRELPAAYDLGAGHHAACFLRIAGEGR
jgi:peptide/nickel transport system ATP-binding protein